MRVFVSIETSREYNRALLRGITRYSRHRGSWSFYYPPPFWERKTAIHLQDYLEDRQIEAVITLEQSKIKGILETGLPTVVSPYTRERIPNAINIETDHRAVGRKGAQHLIDCGFRHFAFCGYRNQFWSDLRQAGFSDLIKKHGHRPFVFETPHYQTRSSRDEIMKWLRSLPPRTGIMACVDERGRDLIEACLMARLAVPETIGIVAVDNDTLICNLSPIPLSSVANNAEEAGFEAARLLDGCLQSGKTVSEMGSAQVLPTRCIGRQSTDLIFSDDPTIAKSINFIRENSESIIQVSDVCRAAGVSRRALEKSFQTRLGRTIHSEIKRNKILLFQKLLIETDCSIAMIAEKIGLTTIEHASRYFKSATHVTPLQFRKENAHTRGNIHTADQETT